MAKKHAKAVGPCKPGSIGPVKKRGRPKKRPSELRLIDGLRLRDALKQLDDEGAPVEFADASFKVQMRSTVDMLRLYSQGQAVFISRGILRAIIAELG